MKIFHWQFRDFKPEQKAVHITIEYRVADRADEFISQHLFPGKITNKRQRDLAIMRVADGQSFPISWGLCPKRGKSARVGEHVVRHKWYYAPTCSGKFWLLCDKYGGRDAQIFPFLGLCLKGGKRPNWGGGAYWAAKLVLCLDLQAFTCLTI